MTVSYQTTCIISASLSKALQKCDPPQAEIWGTCQSSNLKLHRDYLHLQLIQPVRL
ncbi:hypothetical protein CY34DRAFT_799939 [Suillus luteus UH-Slu-Lm8-n1]|uniref:Uncharacterized protein n=1 Tax=Suillus luteus UH-Slu-Lm8-n1 TaxID=930992 RepID=A0A0D0BVD4_9AGAM|nr:hypothetical protein CY34DRAFT_799939 [Suillus luteus UH-Slu-Lm8-n1]